MQSTKMCSTIWATYDSLYSVSSDLSSIINHLIIIFYCNICDMADFWLTWASFSSFQPSEAYYSMFCIYSNYVQPQSVRQFFFLLSWIASRVWVELHLEWAHAWAEYANKNIWTLEPIKSMQFVDEAKTTKKHNNNNIR